MSHKADDTLLTDVARLQKLVPMWCKASVGPNSKGDAPFVLMARSRKGGEFWVEVDLATELDAGISDLDLKRRVLDPALTCLGGVVLRDEFGDYVGFFRRHAESIVSGTPLSADDLKLQTRMAELEPAK